MMWRAGRLNHGAILQLAVPRLGGTRCSGISPGAGALESSETGDCRSLALPVRRSRKPLRRGACRPLHDPQPPQVVRRYPEG